MNDMELDKRKARAATETLVISQTEGGFRVYNPANITHIYMVSGTPEVPTCNCPDFQAHQNDPEWRCKHILAVLNQLEKQKSQPTVSGPTHEKEPESGKTENSVTEKKKPKAQRNGQHSQMLIKRSISPDGHIDSLSVEFSNPIDRGADEEIKQQAQKTLKLQAEIVTEFLKGHKANGGGATEKTIGNANGDNQSKSHQLTNGLDGAVPAQLLNIAGMNTRGGWKTFINVQVNGITTKLFGNKRELGEHITAAGFASIADHISQGMLLNLPCRVITTRSQDGKYLNINKVLPAKPLQSNGRAGQ